MSKKNRERREGEGGTEDVRGSGGGNLNWVPILLSVGALGLGFWAATGVSKVQGDLTKRMVDVDQRLTQLQTQVANAAKAKPAPSQGPDPNKVYTIKTEGSPTHGYPTAPIVIAEFSDYQ